MNNDADRMPRYTGPETRRRKTLMSKEEIKERFDRETASVYSQRDPAWLPEFRYAFSLFPKLLQTYAAGGRRILDLGAGTGNLSRVVLETIPDAIVELMDFSANMLSEAPRVLEAFRGRFTLTEGDFMTQPLEPMKYAAVISSFAIHHCRGEDEYLTLYKKIRGSLCPPGIFVCCDVVNGADDFFTGVNEEGWVEFLKSQNFGEQEITKILSNYKVEDTPLAVGRHLALLLRAGFKTADVVWKKANFAVYAAAT